MLEEIEGAIKNGHSCSTWNKDKRQKKKNTTQNEIYYIAIKLFVFF